MITIEIDDKSPQAKKVVELLNTFEFVSVINKKGSSKNGRQSEKIEKETSPYDPEFVKKIKKAEENVKKGNYRVLSPEYKKKLFGK